jgi:hypothetical protein
MDWKPRPLAEAATAPGDELGVTYNEEIKSSHSHPFSGYLGTDSSSPTLPTVDCSCTQSPRYTLELCNLPWKQQKTACSHSISLPLNFTIDSYNCTCKAPLLPTWQVGYRRSLTRLKATFCIPLSQMVIQRRSRAVSSLGSSLGQLSSLQTPY